jgi:hypothetical protein
MNAHPLLAVGALLAPLTCQQALSTTFGPTIFGLTGEKVAVGTDFDGDGTADLLVASPGIGQGVVHVVSGDDNSVRTIANPGTSSFPNNTMIGVPDLDLDGRGDIVVDTNGNLHAFSGATLATLWSTTAPSHRHAAPVGDRNGDGRCDLAVVTMSGPGELRVLSGQNGLPIAIYPLPDAGCDALLAIGDQNGDGVPEIARVRGGVTEILRLANPAVLQTIASGSDLLGAANVAGDARLEVLIGNGPLQELRAYDANTGMLVRTWVGLWQGRSAVVGDLNADGFADLVHGRADYSVRFVSGATGSVLATWPGTAQFRPTRFAGGVDMNGDGFGDVLLGSDSASATGASPAPGGWQRLSGKILATMELKPTNCYQGPWQPQIGQTLPRLGGTTTVAGINAPPGTVGIVAASVQPPFAQNLGVAGCDAWFDTGAGTLLATTTTTTWQFSFGIPLLPQLAGIPLAVQAFYGPTATPIGLDLTNGVWSRFGY